MNRCFASSLLGLILTGVVGYPAVGEESIGCDEVDWKQQIIISFDGIEEACQEVIVRKDERYVRFEVEFVRALSDGNVEVMMTLQDGSRTARTFPAPKSFRALSSSGKTDYRMQELDRGDILDVFVPLSRVVVSRN